MEEYPSPVEGIGLENRQVEKSAQGFESLFLRKCCIKKSHIWLVSIFLVAPAGIEPATQGFSVLCSTD